MDNNHSQKLARELEPLQAHIEGIKTKRKALVAELRQVEAELESLAVERQRYDAVQEACTALGKLAEHDAQELFWNELPEVANPGESLDRLRKLPARYREKVAAKTEQKSALLEQIRRHSLELEHLDGEVYEAHLREQQRQSEFVVEREIPFFPMHAAVMPWSKETETERYFRRAVLVSLLLCLLLGGIVPLVNIPLPDRSTEVVVIPERIAKLVKAPPVVQEAEPPAVAAEEEPKPEEKKPEEKKPEPEEAPKVEKTARQKAQSSGVLAFKESFKNLIDDAPVAKVGSKARVTRKAPKAAGSPSGRRSLVAMQATGTSGGINATAISRDLGQGGGGESSKQISAVAFSRVESKVAATTGQEERPSGSGETPGRTDEEIQIVFDRYKATLYRIYNKELRKNPTLRGNILLRLTIEPGGEVSACSVESTDLGSQELVDKIVDRVLKFNFGPKKNAGKVTILYPIDFLPAR